MKLILWFLFWILSPDQVLSKWYLTYFFLLEAEIFDISLPQICFMMSLLWHPLNLWLQHLNSSFVVRFTYIYTRVTGTKLLTQRRRRNEGKNKSSLIPYFLTQKLILNSFGQFLDRCLKCLYKTSWPSPL